MKGPAFLFDLDGVIFDTEGQYSIFWNQIGEEYLGDSDFASKIKGETTATSLKRCCPDNDLERERLRRRLYDFEAQMKFGYIPGVQTFLSRLKEKGCPTAIVTSSNRIKMAVVYKARPEIPEMFGHILTGDDFGRSKPFPDCYLLGMKVCGTSPEDTFIFEDSFNGLESARSSGGHVIALATTNSRDAVAPYADMVIDDFSGLSPEDVIMKAGKRQ